MPAGEQNHKRAQSHRRILEKIPMEPTEKIPRAYGEILRGDRNGYTGGHRLKSKFGNADSSSNALAGSPSLSL
jgi:hypothetical protein